MSLLCVGDALLSQWRVVMLRWCFGHGLWCFGDEHWWAFSDFQWVPTQKTWLFHVSLLLGSYAGLIIPKQLLHQTIFTPNKQLDEFENSVPPVARKKGKQEKEMEKEGIKDRKEKDLVALHHVTFRGMRNIWWRWSVTFCGMRSVWWCWSVTFRGMRSIWWCWSVIFLWHAQYLVASERHFLWHGEYLALILQRHQILHRMQCYEDLLLFILPWPVLGYEGSVCLDKAQRSVGLDNWAFFLKEAGSWGRGRNLWKQVASFFCLLLSSK